MKIPSLRWQPFILSLLIAGTAWIIGWSFLSHFGTNDPFMPHEHCYLMKRDLIMLHGISDFVIGVSYVLISATLTYLVLRARREIPFHWMMLAFATFIVACGATHFMEVWTLQTPHPPYYFAGDVKLITALASAATALLLPPLIPKIMRLLEEARLSLQRKEEAETAHAALQQAHERVQQLDQLKTNFFANISHELRTPLTLILGPVDRLLAAGQLDEASKRELQITRRNALLLHKHVDDLLDVSKLEAGRMQVNYVRTDLANLTRLVGSHFSSSNVRPLDLNIDAPASLFAEVDVEKVQRVLFNLISNAFKFTPDGGSVSVAVRQEGQHALLLVEDTGPGVPSEQREAIFERFHQANTPTTRSGAGTGLGLSIVKEFVQLHHGYVEVIEGAGGGAAFRVQLPLRAPEGTPVSEEASIVPQMADAGTLRVEYPLKPGAHLSPEAAAGRPLILVAEDNADMSHHIVQTLASDYRVATARNGREALELAAEQPPDLILTDLMMPEMCGDELLERLQEDERLRQVPVILLTARADDAMKFRLLEDGAQDYIVKPFSAQELRARVRNQITTKKARDTLQGELASGEQDVARLATEVTLRARELASARDAAESANRAKDQFLAVLSHELRTPLTPALITAQRLASQPDISPEELRRAVDVIRRNIELEAQLIDDLLDVTRIGRGKLQLHLADVDVHEAIHNALEMCQSEVSKQGSKVALELTAARHYVRGDASRILQIVWNLLLNAVKFTPGGGRIVIRSFNGDSGKLVLEVSDNGIGIAAEMLPRIFQPFEQGEESRKGAYGGLGLGLAVVKGLVDAHHGAITASSAGEGHGATFRIELESTDTPAPLTTQAPGSIAPETPSLRILLVEDHEETRSAMERLLARWGHRVAAAGTVKGGLHLAAAQEFDALVSDLGLPDGKGTELMAELRRRGSRTVGVSVSGFGMDDDVRRSLDAGFALHLTKPIAVPQLKEFLAKLAHSLGDRSAQ
jgi:signal transduction histidine kinase